MNTVKVIKTLGAVACICIIVYVANQSLSLHTSSIPATHKQERVLERNHANSYILALDLWEQTANAANSLFDLQCWAGSHENFTVVQPFAATYTLELPPHESKVELSKFFDIGAWNDYSSEAKFATLTNWNDFVQNAPRDVLYVHIIYNHESSCESFSANTGFLGGLGFQVSNQVCIVVPNTASTLLTLEQFNKKIFSGKVTPTKPMTVVFNQCRGIKKDLHSHSKARLVIKDIECLYRERKLCKIVPSKYVLKEADEYSSINWNVSGRDYIAVLIRFEAVKLQHKSIQEAVQECLEFIRQNTETTVFVTTDIDEKFGSQSFRSADQHLSSNFMKQAREQNPQKTIVQFDSSKVRGTDNIQYINWLQGIIAAKARHMLAVGGGNYQVLVTCVHENFMDKIY